MLAVTLLLILSYPVAREWGPFQAIEGMSLDWRFRIRGPQDPGGEVVIVAIDDRTVEALGRWPFSRAWLARAVDALAADGARTIVFDLLLAGSESRGAVPAGRPADGGPAEAGAGGADEELAHAIARAGNVVVPYAFVYDPRAANRPALPAAIDQSAYRVVRSPPGRRSAPGAHPAGVLAPLESLLQAGHPAHVTVFLEHDGRLRFAHPAIRFGDAYYPSLAVEAARLHLGLERDSVALDAGAAVSLGGRRLATDRRMRLAIDYAGPAGTFDSVSLVDVVNGDVPAGRFRDRLVLVGATAAGLGDRFATPYGPGLPGVEVFANVIDGMLGDGFPEASSRTRLLDLLAIAVAGLLAVLVGLPRRPIASVAAAVLLIAAWGAVSLYGFVALQTWVDFTFPALAILLGAVIVVAGRAVRESRLHDEAERRREIQSHYIPPLAAAHLKRGGDDSAAAGGGMAAVLFVDLVGFTAASERMPPDAAAGLLGRFHDLVERAAAESGGVIDKFVGDGALVVFGVPDAGPADAANAVACARRIADEVAGWREGPAPGCGIGVHFGPVTVAQLGGRAHTEITVTGDTVNVASRLEALTRELGATVLLSDAAVEAARAGGAGDALDGFEALPVRRLRGRERPIGIWAWPPPAKG